MLLSYRLLAAGAGSYQPGHHTEWRAFGNSVITHVRDGSCTLETTSDRVVLGPGTAFLLPPGVTHQLRAGPRTATAFETVHFTCQISNLLGIFTLMRRPVMFADKQARQIARHQGALISLSSRDDDTISRFASIDAHLASLVAITVKSCPELEGWAHPHRQRLLPMLRYVQTHLAARIRAEDLARATGLSTSHLTSLSVRILGRAPMEIVRAERMRRARELLHWSPLPVAEVARRSGFEDPYYFTRAFTRAEGVSPSAYRKGRDRMSAWPALGVEAEQDASPATRLA